MEESTDLRSGGGIRAAGQGLGGVITLGAIAWATDFFRMIGLIIFTEQFLAGMLGVALALVFVVQPARAGAARARVPWYDALAVAAALLAAGYVAIHYEALIEALYIRPPDAMAAAIVLIVLSLEGLRRTVGPVLFGVVAVFLLYGVYGHLVPGQLQGRDVPIARLVLYLGLDSNGILGIVMMVSTTIVVAFVFFGHLLARSGGSEFFTDLAVALMGRYRGGSSKIAVTASALFGSISGSAVSNVVSTGVITIPLMRQAGYAAHQAAAIEAVASTGGQLMPPMMGAAAFLMAEFLRIPYREVVLAALIPAILYYVALFIQIDLMAARDGITRVDAARIPRAFAVLRQGGVFLVPFMVIVYALFWLNLRPESAALWAAAAVIVAGVAFGYRGGRMPLRKVLEALGSTGVAVRDIIMIGAGAGMIMGVLNITALGFTLTQTLASFGQGNVLLLLVIAAAVCIVLGMGMPTIGVYVLLATLVAPSLVEVGIPDIAAHLYALYFGMMSMITPPVAIAAFAAASVARADAMRTALDAVRFGWSAYVVPFLFVAAPELLMRGDASVIAVAFVTAVAGVWLISAGMVGYLARPLDPLRRALLVGAGVLLLLPAQAFAWTVWTDLAGIALAAVIVSTEFVAARRSRA